MEVQRVAYLAGDFTHTTGEHRAYVDRGLLRRGRYRLSWLWLLSRTIGVERGRNRGRCVEVDRRQQLARLCQLDAVALGDVGGHRLQTAANHTGEATDSPLGDRHVREPAHVQV